MSVDKLLNEGARRTDKTNKAVPSSVLKKACSSGKVASAIINQGPGEGSAAVSNKKKEGCKKQNKCCSVINCKEPGSTFHTFPKIVMHGQLDERNVERCKLWIERSGNKGLLAVPTSTLNSKRYICNKHFETSQYAGKRLSSVAVPVEDLTIMLRHHDVTVYPVLTPQEKVFYGNIEVENNEAGEEFIEPNMDEFQRKFVANVNNLVWKICPVCKEKFFCDKDSKRSCIHSTPFCRDMSKDNNMDPGNMEAADVVEALGGLTYVEEQLIARVRPIVVVIKLKGHQLGYRGNVINFHQDVKNFAKKLPHNIQDLTNIITVRSSKGLKPVDFRVRADKVRKALQWLIEHNPFYSDVVLDEANLNALPEDSNVFDDLVGFEVPESSFRQDSRKNAEDDEEEEEDIIFESGNPIMRPPSQNEQLQTIFDFPTIGSEPINEFNTEGYIAMAFPTLFPFGDADLRCKRLKKVTPANYFKHLLRFYDGRFARHPRFRYFALNSVMRWSSLVESNIFISANSSLKNMTLKQLKEELSKDKGFARKLMFKNSRIQGLKSYWYMRGKELKDMVEQVGLPTLFFTLSAADHQWPDLFRILAPTEDISIMSMHRKRQLIKSNPLIVDEYFMHRAETFIQEVLQQKFKVKDFWYRVEYQHRGSPHIHGLLWLEDAPDVTNLKTMSNQEKQQIANYFGKFVTAMHPKPDQPKALVHPCQKLISEVVDFDEDLAELLNMVQMHSCSSQYCIRFNKKKKIHECRFHFPQQDEEEPHIVVDSDEPEFKPMRNLPNLNKYNKYIIQTWRANIDVAPVVSKQALINYLSKYITKGEKRSSEMNDVMADLNNIPDENTKAVKIIRSLYMKACAERDFSAQETCHLAMGFKLYSSGGRLFVTLNFNDNNMWQLINDGRRALSLMQKYQLREQYGLPVNVCLWEVAQTFCFATRKNYPANKTAIVQVYPKFKFKENDEEWNEKYYRQQVLLFVPWQQENALKPDDQSWKDTYNQFLDVIKSNAEKACNLQNVIPQEEEYEPPNENDEEIPLEEYMSLSRLGPSSEAPAFSLGQRTSDVEYDWHANTQKYEEYGGIPGLLGFLPHMKSRHQQLEQHCSQTKFTFNLEQQAILDLLDSQINGILNNQSSEHVPKRVIIQGRAGTGKSVLISEMSNRIRSKLGSNSVLLVGPTGVSAININGSTIHSALKIRVGEFEDLNGSGLTEIIQKFENMEFIIIDEFSMVGCEFLHKIDCRLRQAKQEPHKKFGGINIYLVGDINQLPAVLDACLYTPRQNIKTHQKGLGKDLFDSFQKVFQLNQILRQNDTKFQDLLNNISAGSISQQDYNILKSRFYTSLSFQERKQFEDVLHLYPTNEQVDKHNYKKLEELRDPISGLPVAVAKIPAIIRKTGGSKVQADDNLDSTLYVAKGCKIMLKKNLWTEQGLVNGSVGVVEDIVYDYNASPQRDRPAVLICQFPSYKGPYLDDNKKTVPIIAVVSSSDDVSITQFPVSLCYACTIHKSQGITVDKVVVDIGDVERPSGITYVALSRVKSLAGLMIQPTIALNRCTRINKSNSVVLRKHWLTNHCID